jgi:hypothetical protein
MIENYALMAATLIGPILAIQAQKCIERWTEKRNRKLDLFRTLMATRAYRLSHAHVEALNMIEIEFYDCRNNKGKKVMESWRSYFDNLADSDLQKNDHKTWLSQQNDKFIAMLYEMSKFLRYDFDKVSLKRNGYSPQAHGDAEFRQHQIQEHLLKIFSGEQALPMDVKGFPVDDAALQQQKNLNELLKQYLSGETATKVIVENLEKINQH